MAESEQKSPGGLGVFGWLTVTALIALVCGVAIPNFLRARGTGCSNACINNLRQIDGAKQQWALENGKTNGTIVTWDEIKPYLGRGSTGLIPTCPRGGVYTIGSIGYPPTCSYAKNTNDPFYGSHIFPH